MLFLMQIQLLEPHLELDEWLNQIQAVSSYEREWPDAVLRTEEPPLHPTPLPTLTGLDSCPFLPVAA